MTWFEDLTSFQETGAEQVRQNLIVEGTKLVSKANGRTMTWGRLETPTLAELRQRARACKTAPGKLTVRELVADVQSLHKDQANAGALFQVASQFNLLEMISPMITPELGVGGYENDSTQGPSCAIAAGAGTIYRRQSTARLDRQQTARLTALLILARPWAMKITGYGECKTATPCRPNKDCAKLPARCKPLMKRNVMRCANCCASACNGTPK